MKEKTLQWLQQKNKELKKLTLQQKVEKLQYPEGEFWKSKMPQC